MASQEGKTGPQRTDGAVKIHRGRGGVCSTDELGPWMFFRGAAVAPPLFFFFVWTLPSFGLSSGFLLKRQPSQYGGQRAQDQRQAPAVGGSRGSVAAAAQFKQTPAEVEAAGLLLQFLPEVRRPLGALHQRRPGAGVEIVPVSGGRQKTASVSGSQDWRESPHPAEPPGRCSSAAPMSLERVLLI